MKGLIVLLASMLFSMSAMSFECSGNGFQVKLEDDEITIIGNGINLVNIPVTDYGNYYSANVNTEDIRSITFSPDELDGSAKLTFVKSRGTSSVNLTCD